MTDIIDLLHWGLLIEILYWTISLPLLYEIEDAKAVDTEILLH